MRNLKQRPVNIRYSKEPVLISDQLYSHDAIMAIELLHKLIEQPGLAHFNHQEILMPKDLVVYACDLADAMHKEILARDWVVDMTEVNDIHVNGDEDGSA